jgi:hypothetical protein
MSRPIGFDIEEAIKLFKKTPSWAAVAKVLGVHRGSIMAALKPLGYTTSGKPGRLSRKWNVKKVTKLREEGVPVKEIAEQMGIPLSTMYEKLKERP